MATKAFYAGGLLMTIITAWIFHMWGGVIFKFALTDQCGADCFQHFTVFQIALALALYHALLAIILFRGEGPGDVRQWVHKG